MKIAFNAVDLFPGRERLMPFRTILEVAKVMNAKGWNAVVLNSSVSIDEGMDYEWQGVKIVQVPRQSNSLCDYVNRHGYDVFFSPATFRDGLKRDIRGLRQMTCRKFAYIPSGVNPRTNALRLYCEYGYGIARAYLFEAFAPKCMLERRLKKAGFEGVIGLTDYTSLQFRNLKAYTVYAGKDGFESIEADYSHIESRGMRECKFFLFSGAPHPVRGSEMLLDAFDRMVEYVKDARIVFLMRTDVGSEYDRFFARVERLNHKDRIMIIKGPLNVSQLKAWFESAYAVVLPFICIPAEIPITYYEVLSVGTPVVSFHNAGTTEYLRAALKLADGVSALALCNAMCELWKNESDRAYMSEIAKKIMIAHPNWDIVATKWMDIIQSEI